jgi:mono/diheme cytochrome c family protein
MEREEDLARGAPKLIASSAFLVLATIVFPVGLNAQQPAFRNAPASTAGTKNPYAGSASAAAAGQKLYAHNCAACHGNNLQGMGPGPALDSATVRNAKPGALFWFISTGKLSSGMPSWSSLPKQQLWQIVTFLQSPASKAAAK